eukprot:351229-Chlamydomonas_euryale.AAC.4
MPRHGGHDAGMPMQLQLPGHGGADAGIPCAVVADANMQVVFNACVAQMELQLFHQVAESLAISSGRNCPQLLGRGMLLKHAA